MAEDRCVRARAQHELEKALALQVDVLFDLSELFVLVTDDVLGLADRRRVEIDHRLDDVYVGSAREAVHILVRPLERELPKVTRGSVLAGVYSGRVDDDLVRPGSIGR